MSGYTRLVTLKKCNSILCAITVTCDFHQLFRPTPITLLLIRSDFLGHSRCLQQKTHTKGNSGVFYTVIERTVDDSIISGLPFDDFMSSLGTPNCLADITYRTL